MASLDAEDLDGLLACLEELYALCPVEQVGARILRAVTGLISCERASFSFHDPRSGELRAVLGGGSGGALPSGSPKRPLGPAASASAPARERPGGRGSAGSEAEQAPNGGRRPGAKLAAIILADPSEGVLGLALERGRPFGERDRDLLSALQPHLRLAFRNARSFSAALETRGARLGVAAAADAALERLSDRQRAVLALVAAGHSNAGIGAELGISAATVKKHLENIYARLEVSSRLAAARLYLDERGPETPRTLEARLAPGPGDRLSPAGAR